MQLDFYYKVKKNEYKHSIFLHNKDINLLKIHKYYDEYTLDNKKTLENINDIHSNIEIQNIDNWQNQILSKLDLNLFNESEINKILICKLIRYCIKNKIKIDIGF